MNLHVYDDLNHLFLRGLSLPSRSMFAAYEPSDERPDQWSRLADDVGLGRTLAVTAKQMAAMYLRRGGVEAVLNEIPLETWILQSPSSPSAPLASWFNHPQADSRYRLFIHRTPALFRGAPLPVVWDEAYGAVEIALRTTFRDHDQSPSALRDGANVLGDLLVAYRRDPQSEPSLIAGLGHPHHHIG